MEIKAKWNNYKEWQREPHPVAPLKDETHICAACETEYQGNFCPRCGQSAQITSKMSLKKTMLLLIDVWGLGNRGMYQTLKSLMLRPGYMICDYLRGRRSAYFPPFKLLFLLVALSLLVGHGFNILMEDYVGPVNEFTMPEDNTEGFMLWTQWVNGIIQFQTNYPGIFQLVYMGLAGIFFYIFFKKSNIIGKIEIHEFYIALAYMVCMYQLFQIIFQFFGCFGLSEWMSIFFVFLYLIPFKQMSGYSWGKTIGRCTLGAFLGIFSLSVVFLISAIIAYMIEKGIN